MCAGRATHQPTSNGGENIACRNKSVDSRRQQNTAVCSKNKTPYRPGTGVGDGPTRRQQQHRLYESNLSVGFPLNKNCWARRSERFGMFRLLLSYCGGYYGAAEMNEKSEMNVFYFQID